MFERVETTRLVLRKPERRDAAAIGLVETRLHIEVLGVAKYFDGTVLLGCAFG